MLFHHINIIYLKGINHEKNSAICLSFFIFFTIGFAEGTVALGSGSYPGASPYVNGTLSITVDAAPAPGLPAPKILVMRGFLTVYHNNVNWGDTWTISVPAADYRIIPLPVSDGTNFYTGDTIFVTVPPSTLVTKLITYHPI